MTDTGYLEQAFEKFTNAIPDHMWTNELEKLASRVDSEISDLYFEHDDCYAECDLAHCEDGCAYRDDVYSTLSDLLRQIRMGYDVPSTLEILEGLERELA